MTTLYDVLFCFIVAFGVDLPQDFVALNEDYRETARRFLHRHYIDRYWDSLWWIETYHDVSRYQPGTIFPVWIDSYTLPYAQEVERFAFSETNCMIEIEWCESQTDRLLALREIYPSNRDACTAAMWRVHRREEAFRLLWLVVNVQDQQYPTRYLLSDLRFRIGDTAFYSGVMPSRFEP